MPAHIFPRRLTSTPTSITVTAAWPAIAQPNVSVYTTIPMTQTIDQASPSLTVQADSINRSYSGIFWNEDFGTGGAAIFTGGGHSSSHYPYAWIFDGSYPRWQELNVSAPALTYANGSEFSNVQANMPGDASFYGSTWFKPQGTTVSQSPFTTLMAYGEMSTGRPGGWHVYNDLFPVPPNALGLGASGGWACVAKQSVTNESGVSVPWGHKIDAATGVWSRMPNRLPTEAECGIDYLKDGDGIHQGKSAVLGNYAYTCWYKGKTGFARTDLSTGVITVHSTTNDVGSYPHWQGIPGTTLMFTLHIPYQAPAIQATIRIIDVNTALGSRTWTDITNWTGGNTMPTGYGEEYGFGDVGAVWVPEVGKIAVFGTGSGVGTWPMKIYWCTPPANVQANWSSGAWTMTEEALTTTNDGIANIAANRGSYGNRYNALMWSSKLRCFLHMARPAAGYCFFFRTAQVP